AMLRNRYGVRITAQPTFDRAETQPVVVHYNLGRWAGHDGAIPLAIDPWLVFRRHTTPPLTQSALGDDQQPAPPRRGGLVILPGGDQRALQAWTAQLLQHTPGRFETDPERWGAVRSQLPRSGRFQRGALTYAWEDVWPRLFGSEQAWVYAPLSRVQSLPGDRTSVLEADLFPIPESWNEYGLQARVLWANPIAPESKLYGRRMERDLTVARQWLQRLDVQAQIAGMLNWAPAHRLARAGSPLAATAHRAWLGSSYVWEDITHDTNKQSISEGTTNHAD
ncbi:MAG: hypothetical protein LC641_13165, partial [Spirochaeta sp.]|nr:hypothetical protein [Spirochaeta sp.]